MNTPYPTPFFTPEPEAAGASRIVDFARWAAATQRGGKTVEDPTDYTAPHRWSVTDLEGFWGAVWAYFDIGASTPYERVLAEETMPGARWFPGATLNYAHHALRNLADEDMAIVALDETGSGYEVTGEQLRAQVASVAATLRDLGVGTGDRVVGYLPNTPQLLVGLAAPALGTVAAVGLALLMTGAAVVHLRHGDPPVRALPAAALAWAALAYVAVSAAA
jgi:acetoacetyl-CoA synthetase